MDLLSLFMPEPTIKRVLLASTDAELLAVAEDIQSMIESSLTGKRLFGSAWKKVLVVRLQGIVNQAIADLRASDAITKSLYETVKGTHLKAMNAIPEQQSCCLTDARCNSEHLDHALQAVVKDVAVRAGLLTKLPCEEVDTAAQVAVKVEPSLLVSHSAARNDLLKYLSYETEDTEQGADLLLACLKQNEKRLLTASRWWAHDAKVIENLCTDSAGCQRLREYKQLCLPSSEHAISVESALQKSTEYLASIGFKWSAAGSKAQIKQVHAWLTCLHENVTPTRNSQASNWIVEMWALLPYFIRECGPKKEDNGDKTGEHESGDGACFGADALKLQWAKEKTRKPRTIDGCRYFVTWSFITTETFQDEVRAELRKLKGDGSKTGAASSATPYKASAASGSKHASSTVKSLKPKQAKAVDTDEDRLLAELLKAK
eukprot:3697380-Amphidinium_carterae.1